MDCYDVVLSVFFKFFNIICFCQSYPLVLIGLMEDREMVHLPGEDCYFNLSFSIYFEGYEACI
jgi:hypothetical protein